MPAMRPPVEPAPPLNLTVPQALARFAGPARVALKDEFARAGVPYPPAKLTLVGLKQERVVLLFAGAKPKLIAQWPLSTFSGKLGPKLREGDLQIPEGTYKITGLRASFRLSVLVDYPNRFDRLQAAADKRTHLGGDILIHNGTHSTGCLVLSIDDMAQIFTAAHDVGCANVTLIIAPCNLSKGKPALDMASQPGWLPLHYEHLRRQLSQYPLPSLPSRP
ncbi:MAG: hypothetical protein KGS72_13155 [Cyanobacteria bacterium REEB67]|nr:hypothetical protein [Cyanobacteria bacterium REEB67]